MSEQIVYVPTPVSEFPPHEGYYHVGKKDMVAYWHSDKRCWDGDVDFWLKPVQLSTLVGDGWISVEDRLPSKSTSVLCYNKNAPHGFEYTIEDIVNVKGTVINKYATHWKTLTPPAQQ